MEYYQTLRRKEILTRAIALRHPKDTLSEISQAQKDKYSMTPLNRRQYNSWKQTVARW